MALLACGAIGGCCGPRLAPEQCADLGFRSPRQAVNTFQVALAGDLVDLEYRCFSSAFKQREGLNQLAYREFRERLVREQPYLARFAEAELVEARALDADSALVLARLDTWWTTVEVEVRLVREDYWELWSSDVRLLDDAADLGKIMERRPGSLAAVVPLPAEFDAGPVTELRAGSEWKIDDFRQRPPD